MQRHLVGVLHPKILTIHDIADTGNNHGMN